MSWLGCLFGDAGDDRAAAFEAIADAPPQLAALGDIVSTEGDCKAGELAVSQLLALYAKLGAPAKYAAGVAAIKASYDDAEGSWSRHVPFTPVCGQIKAIGRQADELSKSMAAEAGQALPGGVTTQDPQGALEKGLGSLTTGIVLIGGVLAVGYAANAYARTKGR